MCRLSLLTAVGQEEKYHSVGVRLGAGQECHFQDISAHLDETLLELLVDDCYSRI
jgi:hypothetical protein